MKILMAAITAIAIIVFILWCCFKLICKIDDWAHADPEMNDVTDYGHWKFLNGIRQYQSPKQDAILRKVYEKRNG